MTAAADQLAGDQSAHGLLCYRCDYDLSGLDPSGSCPECNTPISESLAKLRRFSPPAYLRCIQRGARYQRVASWLLLLAGLVLLGRSVALRVAFLLDSSRLLELTVMLYGEPPLLYLTVIAFVGLLTIGTLTIGCWLLSARQADTSDASQLKRRVMLRVWLVLSLAPLAALTGMSFLPAQTIPGLFFRMLLWVALLVSACVFLLAPGPLVRSLGERIPDERVVRAASTFHRIARVLAALVLVGYPPSLFVLVISAPGSFASFHLQSIMMLATAVLTFVLLVAYVRMATRLHRAVAAIGNS
ncbi:MAG: hypothetical protein AAFN41_12705, partial [Planctomycetota bacterium]